MMNALITNGIKVSVETRYAPSFSNPRAYKFFFAYNITIENKSDHTVQLLSRHWYIHDSNTDIREVQGDGVVGNQPVLAPNDIYSYSSGCPLDSDIGIMYGKFTMQRQMDDSLFEVDVPEFLMVLPYRLN